MSMVEAVNKDTTRAIAATADVKRPSHQLTPKQVTACRAIVHDGLELDQAAALAGLTTRRLRIALSQPHVIQWVKAEREVFRAHVASQNIHRAKQMRDTAGNAMAQLGAMKFIEQIGDEPGQSAGAARSPGFVIVVNAGANPVNVQTIQPAKTIEHE